MGELEVENKFILDVDPTGFWSSGGMPPRFNRTCLISSVDTENYLAIRGRVLPRTEPYCYASFLIEITLFAEWPFRAPEVIFLDPIYHPNMDEWNGHRCDCWYAWKLGIWTPRTSLKALIEAIIQVIDDYPDSRFIRNHECMEEYRNDYETFYKKASSFVLSFGRPRH